MRIFSVGPSSDRARVSPNEGGGTQEKKKQNIMTLLCIYDEDSDGD